MRTILLCGTIGHNRYKNIKRITLLSWFWDAIFSNRHFAGHENNVLQFKYTVESCGIEEQIRESVLDIFSSLQTIVYSKYKVAIMLWNMKPCIAYFQAPW